MKKIVFKSIIYSALLLFMPGLPIIAQDLQSAIKLTRSEQFRKADIVYQTLLQKNPNDGSVYFYYGENYLQKYYSDTLTYSINEMADSAYGLFQTGNKMEPDNPLNYVGLGEIALVKRKIPDAQTYFDRAFELLPSKTNKTSTLSKKEQGVVMIKMANAYLKAGINDSSKVFSLLRKAEQLDNKNFDLFIVKGDAYMQLLNDGSTAIANYNKAQNLNPKSPRAKLRLGQLWVKANNLTSALNYYSEAIKIDSNYAPAFREMGYLLLKTHQPAKAKESYAKFLSLSAGSRIARIQYINNLFELEDYSEAIKQINIVMDKDSSNNDLNRALGYSYYETGQYNKGLHYMTKFFDNAQPGKIRTMDFVYYGKLLSKNNLDSLSGEVLMKAFQMDTTQTELLNQAISSFIKVKDYNKAAQIVIKKTMMKKDVGNDYYTLGKLYYNLHEWHKADSVFSINISLNPENIKGYLWKAYSLVNQDPDTKEGLAKPAFEMLVEKAKSDSLKNRNELKVAYSYLAYYYLLQYIKTKERSNGVISKEYCEKILAIDPADEKAKIILKELFKSLKPE
jgi:tetratricopeptide (TPR) repeat protein